MTYIITFEITFQHISVANNTSTKLTPFFILLSVRNSISFSYHVRVTNLVMYSARLIVHVIKTKYELVVPKSGTLFQINFAFMDIVPAVKITAYIRPNGVRQSVYVNNKHFDFISGNRSNDLVTIYLKRTRGLLFHFSLAIT